LNGDARQGQARCERLEFKKKKKEGRQRRSRRGGGGAAKKKRKGECKGLLKGKWQKNKRVKKTPEQTKHTTQTTKQKKTHTPHK